MCESARKARDAAAAHEIDAARIAAHNDAERVRRQLQLGVERFDARVIPDGDVAEKDVNEHVGRQHDRRRGGQPLHLDDRHDGLHATTSEQMSAQTSDRALCTPARTSAVSGSTIKSGDTLRSSALAV